MKVTGSVRRWWYRRRKKGKLHLEEGGLQDGRVGVGERKGAGGPQGGSGRVEGVGGGWRHNLGMSGAERCGGRGAVGGSDFEAQHIYSGRNHPNAVQSTFDCQVCQCCQKLAGCEAELNLYYGLYRGLCYVKSRIGNIQLFLYLTLCITP